MGSTGTCSRKTRLRYVTFDTGDRPDSVINLRCFKAAQQHLPFDRYLPDQIRDGL